MVGNNEEYLLNDKNTQSYRYVTVFKKMIIFEVGIHDSKTNHSVREIYYNNIHL